MRWSQNGASDWQCCVACTMMSCKMRIANVVGPYHHDTSAADIMYVNQITITQEVSSVVGARSPLHARAHRLPKSDCLLTIDRLYI